MFDWVKGFRDFKRKLKSIAPNQLWLFRWTDPYSSEKEALIILVKRYDYKSCNEAFEDPFLDTDDRFYIRDQSRAAPCWVYITSDCKSDWCLESYLVEHCDLVCE